MRKDLVFKTKTLAGTSDLTLLATIKPDLVPALESVTYKTRLKRLLATLNTARSASHEYSLLRPFSDAVERVGKIHSVRVAIVEPDKVLLSVTFDGGWESYLRILWQKVGTLLDVIFCNTENYPSAWESRFEDWADWVRRVQIETDFFYAMPGLTVEDVRYLRSSESLRRSLPARADEGLAAVQQATRSAEAIAGAVISDDFNPLRVKEFGRQGLRALALVYRLASVYLPAGPDGGFLRRAARDLLYEFVAQCESGSHLLDDVLKEGRGRFDEQIDWLLEPVGVRKTPDLPTARPPYDKGEVQGGILSPYEDIDHGCLLLMRFHDRQAAAGFLDAIRGWVTLDSGKQKEKANLPFVNVAFTCEGLRAIGLSQTQIDLFPQEFREGMEARASLLGDRGPHHPRRWRLPRRNWNALPGAQQPAVELAAVHVMVQMRTDRGTPSTGDTLDPGDPLFAHVTALLGASPGTELLAVQPMVRYVETVGGEKVAREHFGFVDASAQPVIDPVEKGKIYPNQVHLGEFLLDHDNEAEVPQDPEEACDPEAAAERRAWLRNGSFLVVRKLSQDVEALTTACKDSGSVAIDADGARDMAADRTLRV